MQRKALVLFSGGQDSTTCLYWALREFDEVEAIGFYYGQPHSVELSQARKIARGAGIRFKVIHLKDVFPLSGLLDDKSASPVVHGRNLVFLSISASHAKHRGIGNVVIGCCREDRADFPDCHPHSFTYFQEAVDHALGEYLCIQTPLIDKDKAEVWKLAAELGDDVLEIVRTESHTDYGGNRKKLHEWGYGNPEDAATAKRARGYERAKAEGWLT